MEILFAVLAAVGVLAVLHRLALAMEGRGWIYYRRRRGTSGSLGNALLEVHSILEPSRKAVLEARQGEVGGDEESGDPPEPGSEVDADASADGLGTAGAAAHRVPGG